jgi:hypothetical protein
LTDANFRCLMKDRVDIIKSRSNRLRIAHIRANKLGGRIKKSGRVVSVNLGHEQIQHADAMSALNQGIGQMRADKAGSAGDQDV